MGIFFNLYGDNAAFCLIGFAVLFIAAVAINEVSRRTKIWGIIFFIALPCAMAIYSVVINVCASCGIKWARLNYTYLYRNNWFYYFRLYCAVICCIGFMIIRLVDGAREIKSFKLLPYTCTAFYTAICACVLLISGIMGYTLDGKVYFVEWWSIILAIAGFMNIASLSGAYGIYVSKRRQDVLCPNLNWFFIAAHSVWSFAYVYVSYPDEAWFYIPVILAPAFANAAFNRGGWLQNRVQILTLWLMFAQVLPMLGSQWAEAVDTASVTGAAYGVLAVVSLALNLLCLASVVYRGVKQKKNPYLNEVFKDTAYYKSVAARMETDGKMSSD